MGMEYQENDGFGASRLSEVTQIHERRLCEQGKISVTQPDEEAGGLRLEDARVLAEGLGAAQTGTGVENELAARRGQIRHE